MPIESRPIHEHKLRERLLDILHDTKKMPQARLDLLVELVDEEIRKAILTTARAVAS